MFRALFTTLGGLFTVLMVVHSLGTAVSATEACSRDADKIGFRHPDQYAAALVCCDGRAGQRFQHVAFGAMGLPEKAAATMIEARDIRDISRANVAFDDACSKSGLPSADISARN